MPNPYYTDANTIQSGGVARADPVKNEFAKLEVSFDAADVQLERRIKVPSGVTSEITEEAAQRALKAVGFDADGNVSLLSALGTWRGDWATGTVYANQDIVRDPATPFSLYIANGAHTAGAAFNAGEKTDHWTVIIDLTELARAEEVKYSFGAEQTASFTAVTGGDYLIDATSAITVTLPASPSINDHIRLMHVAGDIANLTVARNGQPIMGLAENLTFASSGDNDATNASFALIFTNATRGWRIFPV